MLRIFNLRLFIMLFNVIFINLDLAAQNLVLNSSFEDTTTCPITSPPLSYLRPINWFRPTGGSSDFFNSATNCPWGGGVPNNPFGFQFPKSGMSMCGFAVYASPPLLNQREYVSGTLDDTLMHGHEYCISFYVSAANNHKYQTDDIGAYFSNDTSFTDYTMNNVLTLIPQVENTQGNILSDTLGWMQVSGNFIAQGGERFITIGNFKNDANTTLTSLAGAIYNSGYYYIDDVSVIDCTVGINELDLIAKDITLFPNPCKVELTVEISNVSHKILHCEIKDVLGKHIFFRSINSGKEIIDVSLLKEGVYFINISSNLNSVMKKFIKLDRNLQ